MAKIQRKKAPPAAKAAPAAGTPFEVAPRRRRRGRVRSKVLVQFTTQLATLQNAGLPIVRCLRILTSQQRPGPFQDALQMIGDDVEGGDSLSVALSKHEGVFDPLYLNMVKAGEAGGILDEVLERLAQFQEKADEIKSKVIGALAYPAFVALFALVVVFFVMIVVVPRFREIFTQLDASLPPITEALLGAAAFLQGYWWVVLLAGGLGVALFKVLMRARGFRRFIHRWQMRVPLFGPLVKKTIVARFSRTLGTLLNAGVPILEALAIVRDSVANVVVGEALEEVHRNIKQGETITRPMQESGVFDDVVVNMVDVGEESGTLDRMLIKVADAYEREVDDAVSTVFKIIEPLILLVLAVGVGTIVVALFLPILKVMDRLAG